MTDASSSLSSLIWADWPAPDHVKACVSTRIGGFSPAPYDSFNMGDHVGDAPANVVKNRARFLHLCRLKRVGQWLTQVHGTQVVEAKDDGKVREGDAVYSQEANLPCVVMTADCLPVLFTDEQGSVVAAAHAGWRGLASGVLEKTVATMGVAPSSVLAWMGPAIGRHQFEVGGEVRREFVEHHPATDQAFQPDYQSRGKYYADLYELARIRLGLIGVHQVFGGGFCTWKDERFYSFRREGTTGRMASMIWIKK